MDETLWSKIELMAAGLKQAAKSPQQPVGLTEEVLTTIFAGLHDLNERMIDREPCKEKAQDDLWSTLGKAKDFVMKTRKPNDPVILSESVFSLIFSGLLDLNNRISQMRRP